MKALVYTGPEAMEYRDAPCPVPEADQQLICVDSVGICGSDMHGFLGHDDRRPAPLILGHEAAGVIMGGDRHGDRVTVNPLVGCGTCSACQAGQDNICAQRTIISMPPREGAFAEKLAMNTDNLVSVPDHIPLSKASLAEPIACGWHAARLGLRIVEAQRALVIGGGAIGVGSALSAMALGIGDVTLVEPNDLRRDYLRKMDEFKVTTPDDAGNGYDLIIDGVGYPATRAQACAAVRPGGVITHIGLGSGEGGMDVRRMTLQEITFIGTYTYTPQDFRDTAQAIFDGRLGALNWTETRHLKDGEQAFNDIRAGRVAAPKIILKPR